MNKRILALCDSEQAFTFRLQEYLCSREDLPFEIHAFTSKEQLLVSGGDKEIELLLIAESDYSPDVGDLPVKTVIILNETGQNTLGEGMEQVNKYQSPEQLVCFIMDVYMDRGALPSKIKKGSRTKFIGAYSPVGRSLQTSFALTLGQVLAREEKTLYLNFESFSGFENLLKKQYSADLLDLLYYYENSREKFRYKMESMMQTVNGLYFIPPVYSYQDLQEIEGCLWLEFMDAVAREEMFTYVIMDLSDCIQGLFEILRRCGLIYTMTKEDGLALAKVRQYEELLRRRYYQDVLDKTKKKSLPFIRELPADIDQFTLSELAGYAKKAAQEDIYGRL